MNEFELIRRYFTRRAKDDAVLIGVGDDGAMLSPAPGRELVTVIDTLVAGVHYPVDLPAADAGFRAVAVNLSDIAAMGATPRWMTLALTLPAASREWLSDFSSGLFEAADAHGVSLVGGDTTRGSATVITVQIIGDICRDAAMQRSGARPGEAIFLTGTVGDAAAGLELLGSGGAATPRADYLIRRFARPEPPVEFGRAIAPRASAAIDLSDGLVADLGRLAAASGVRARLDVPSLPLSPQIRQQFEAGKAEAFALGGGDDYELCFVAPADREDEIMSTARSLATTVTRVGATETGSGILCVDGHDAVEAAAPGYRHF